MKKLALLICSWCISSFTMAQPPSANAIDVGYGFREMVLLETDLVWTTGQNIADNTFYVCSFTLLNPENENRELYIRLPNGWQAHLYFSFHSQDGNFLSYDTSYNGKEIPIKLQSFPSYQNYHKAAIPARCLVTVNAKWLPYYSIYRLQPVNIILSPPEVFQKRNIDRHLWQGIFFGVILVMALYNLFLFFAVRDNSYLHYVLSIIGVGLYFAFYYGFGLEYLWPHAPRWDTWCYTIIVPFTSLARLWFTRTYLHTPTTLPRLNKLMQVLNWLMMATLLTGLITYLTQTDWLAPLVTTIGILNTFILIIMLAAGILAYRKKYAPARYFIFANAPLVVGAIAFILREMGYLPDSWFTRYSVQVGVVIQVVLFALGLASRLNQTRNELAAQRIEKERLALEAERERKELIESQKLELEERVRSQTRSLIEQNEKLSQLNAVKDKLFSVLTHDLRNPLATMQSFLKLLTEQYDRLSEDDKVKLFKEAQDSLDHLNRLLFHLLQWSKSQMNLLEFSPVLVDLAQAVERNRRVLHLQARLKQIDIHSEVPEGTTVYADANMLDFIIRNLLSNAIKFSHKGGKVEISSNRVQGNVSVNLTDHGIGMQPDMVEQVRTTHITTARRGTAKEKGTGLGLLISREFIEKNNGQILIESSVGNGTTVTFTLPGVES